MRAGSDQRGLGSQLEARGRPFPRSEPSRAAHPRPATAVFPGEAGVPGRPPAPGPRALVPSSGQGVEHPASEQSVRWERGAGRRRLEYGENLFIMQCILV